jgi:hypothetical protein
MSDGIKIALGIGAVAIVGYFVVSTINKPKVVPSETAANNTTTAFVSGIIQGFGGLFTSKAGAPANAPLTNIGSSYTSASGGASATDPSNVVIQDTGFDTSNYTTQNGSAFTDANGNFVLG